MADYESKSRTNYFPVTDESRLREIVDKCSSDGYCLLVQNAKDKTKFSIRISGAFNGLSEPTDENCEECKNCSCRDCGECELSGYDNAIEKLYEELQKILPAGEAVIMTEVGGEELRYLTGLSTIITKDDFQQLDLSDLSLKAARKMLLNRKFVTEMDY